MWIVFKQLLLALLLFWLNSQAKSLPVLEATKPESPKYVLKIKLPDGSEREETTELKYPGTSDEELVVKGVITTYFTYPFAKEVTIFEAGKNGYTVKYKYEITKPKIYQFLSENALKSAAG